MRRISLVLLAVLVYAGSNFKVDGSNNLALDQADSNLVETQESAARNYIYSSGASRVRDLVGFYESMSGDNESSNRDKQNKIISLSEAANKLRFLTDGLPLDTKCNKYVKLINRPNIRTYSTVNLLVAEEKLAIETVQLNANLVSQLMGERQFDALGRIQTIIQSLEAEKENSKSSYTPAVQKDLLDCIDYYIYRHQRATSGLIVFAREAKEELARRGDQLDSSVVLSKKFSSSMDKIRRIEIEENETKVRNSSVWLNELSKLHQLVVENHYDIPKVVRNFVTEPRRLDRMNDCNIVLTRLATLKEQILSKESVGNNIDSDDEYKQLLNEYAELVEQNNDLVREELKTFIKIPHRQQLNDREIVGLPPNEPTSETAVQSEPEVATEIAIEVQGNQDELQTTPVTVTNPTIIKDHCKESLDKFNNLRSLNIRSANLSQVVSLTDHMIKFKRECLSGESNNDLQNQSRWSMISTMKRLNLWCSNRLRSNNLEDGERHSILEVMETIRNI